MLGKRGSVGFAGTHRSRGERPKVVESNCWWYRRNLNRSCAERQAAELILRIRRLGNTIQKRFGWDTANLCVRVIPRIGFVESLGVALRWYVSELQMSRTICLKSNLYSRNLVANSSSNSGLLPDCLRGNHRPDSQFRHRKMSPNPVDNTLCEEGIVWASDPISQHGSTVAAINLGRVPPKNFGATFAPPTGFAFHHCRCRKRSCRDNLPLACFGTERRSCESIIIVHRPIDRKDGCGTGRIGFEVHKDLATFSESLSLSRSI